MRNRYNVYFYVVFFLLGILILSSTSFSSCGVIWSPSNSTFISKLIDGDFIFGVWLQDPLKIRNNQTNALNYKEIGINTFVGLWQWPAEDWAYEGYSMAVAKELQRTGMMAIAGDNIVPSSLDSSKPNKKTAVDWNYDHPEFKDTFVGYLLGDEPDMKKNNDSTNAKPDNWKNKGDLLREADFNRPIYANFGKGFALDPWSGYIPDYGSTSAIDFAKYVEPTLVISSDYYGITDPWEPKAKHGIWMYGLSVKNTKKYAGKRPVLGFIEASCPWSDSENSGQRYQIARRMKAEYIMPIVWNMVISGAKGIIYFCHDLSDGVIDTNLGYDAIFAEPGMAEAVKASNESVSEYTDILRTDDLEITSITTDGVVDVIALTKKYNGNIYIFAQGNGNSDNIFGSSVNATFTINSVPSGTIMINVINEYRSIEMNNNTFTDYFEPYEIHIYKF